MLRFAPSPTGDLHISDLRVALLNYIYSKQVGEAFTIRIEDLDENQNIEGKDKEILGLLELFGIEYETLSYQSENKKRHQLMALQLINTKRAFNCFCSDEKLKKDRQDAEASGKPYRYDGSCENLPPEATIDNPNPFSVRIKRPLTSIEYKDRVQGEQQINPEDFDTFVILDKNKLPTPIFAAAVDDMISDISLIIRSKEHILNTPKQMAVRAALGYTKSIEYAHLPLMLNDSGQEIDNTDKESSVKWLLEQGILPEALMNYLISLGSTLSKKIFTMQEAIKLFDIGQLSQEPVTFDINQLYAINREHLQMMDDLELSRYVGFADADIGKAAKIYLDEANTTRKLKEKISAIFAPKPEDGSYGPFIKECKSILKDAPHFNTFAELKDYIGDKSGADNEALSHALHILLTGAEQGPDLEKLYPLIKNYITEIIK